VIHELVRSVAEPLTGDRRMDGDIAGVLDLIRSGTLTDAALCGESR
jgi:hypothetical protein